MTVLKLLFITLLLAVSAVAQIDETTVMATVQRSLVNSESTANETSSTLPTAQVHPETSDSSSSSVSTVGETSSAVSPTSSALLTTPVYSETSISLSSASDQPSTVYSTSATNGQSLTTVSSTPANVQTTSTQCSATVASIAPTYGPLQGHTNVAVTLTPHVEFTAGYSCQISTGLCENVSKGDQGMLSMPSASETKTVTIMVYVESCGNVSAGNFTYRQNPAGLQAISAMKTLITGGTRLYISGTGLDASVSSKLVVNVDNDKFSGPCEERNSTLIVCEIPDLSKSQIGNKNFTDGELVNGFSITTDVLFDDFLLHVTPLALSVYQHPSLEPLVPLQEFIANQNNSLTIKGQNLVDRGFTADDITVTIGDPKWMITGSNTCTGVMLTDTTITCYPPQMNPDLIKFPPSSDVLPSQPNVTVIIGSVSGPHYAFAANQITYTLDEPFNVVMIIMIAILSFVIVMSLTCVILTVCGCGRRPQSTAGLAEATPYRPVSADDACSSSDDMEGSISSKSARRKDKSPAMQKRFDGESSGIQVKAVRKKSELDNDAGYDNIAAYENVAV